MCLCAICVYLESNSKFVTLSVCATVRTVKACSLLNMFLCYRGKCTYLDIDMVSVSSMYECVCLAMLSLVFGEHYSVCFSAHQRGANGTALLV